MFEVFQDCRFVLRSLLRQRSFFLLAVAAWWLTTSRPDVRSESTR